MIARVFACLRASATGPEPAAHNPGAAPQPLLEPQAPVAHSAPRVTPSAPQQTPAKGAMAGNRRLARALRDFQRTVQTTRWCTIALRDDNMYVWDTAFYFTCGPMHESLHKHRLTHVRLEVSFPTDYPAAAPTVRVIQPHISHIDNASASNFGGALCIESLHKWDPTTAEENLLAALHQGIATATVAKVSNYNRAAYDAGRRIIETAHPTWRPPPCPAQPIVSL